MKKATTTIALLLVVFWTFQCTGCFFAAAPRPHLEDGTPLEPGQIIVPKGDLAAIKTGKTIEVVLLSGRRVSGPFQGLAPVAEEVYIARYDQKAKEAGPAVALPELGERLTIEDHAGNVYEGEFAGFDQWDLYSRLPGKHQPVRFNLKMVKALWASGEKEIPPGPLMDLIARGRVPFRSALRLDLPREKISIPLEKVSQVIANKPPDPGSLVFTLIVAAAVYGFVWSFKNMSF